MISSLQVIVIHFYFAWNYFLRISRKDHEREIIFPPNIFHHISISFWDWVLKGVSAAVQSIVVM